MTNRIFNISPSPNSNYKESKRFDSTGHVANQNDRGTFRNDLPPEGNSNNLYRAIPVSSSGIPISQSGNSQMLISSDNVKTIENNGEPVIQSGHTTCYFGAENFYEKCE